MDDLDEYLSLVQSLKTYHTPVVELNLEPLKRAEPIQDYIENVSSDRTVVTSLPVKKLETEIAAPPKELVKTVPLAPVTDPLHATMKKALPKHIFYEYPPIGISPTKKLPSCTLPNVPLFFYRESNANQKFLESLISAIQNKFALSSAAVDAKEIEEDNLWRSVTSMSHLRCAIIDDTWIGNSLHGRCWYRRDPNTNNCFLGTIPLIVLSSKADWYLELENKKVLWNQLCRILKKPSHKSIVP